MSANSSTSRYGRSRSLFERNRTKVINQNDICALCGKTVDKNLKYPNPWSATVDHIIPINRGGHKTDLNNLQLAHFRCNRLKSDRFGEESEKVKKDKASNQTDFKNINRDLKKTIDWESYRS